MKKVKLSPWHNGTVKPVHIGVYERQDRVASLPNNFSFWDGQYWLTCYENIDEANAQKKYGYPSGYQYLKWRGIVK